MMKITKQLTIFTLVAQVRPSTGTAKCSPQVCAVASALARVRLTLWRPSTSHLDVLQHHIRLQLVLIGYHLRNTKCIVYM